MCPYIVCPLPSIGDVSNRRQWTADNFFIIFSLQLSSQHTKLCCTMPDHSFSIAVLQVQSLLGLFNYHRSVYSPGEIVNGFHFLLLWEVGCHPLCAPLKSSTRKKEDGSLTSFFFFLAFFFRNIEDLRLKNCKMWCPIVTLIWICLFLKGFCLTLLHLSKLLRTLFKLLSSSLTKNCDMRHYWKLEKKVAHLLYVFFFHIDHSSGHTMQLLR